jgi:hypothetical protein
MANVPDGAVRYGRRRQSARIAGLAACCAALAIALGVVTVAVFLSRTSHYIQHAIQGLPSPGASLSSPGTKFPLITGKTPGVDLLVQITGIGSLLAAIGALACGTAAVITLQRRKREQPETR